MFGETDYDLSRQYASVPMEELLEALGKGIDAGKVLCRGLLVLHISYSSEMLYLLVGSSCLDGIRSSTLALAMKHHMD
jgi:hypothetical protein